MRKSELSGLPQNAQATVIGGCKTLFDTAASAFSLGDAKVCTPYKNICMVGLLQNLKCNTYILCIYYLLVVNIIIIINIIIVIVMSIYSFTLMSADSFYSLRSPLYDHHG